MRNPRFASLVAGIAFGGAVLMGGVQAAAQSADPDHGGPAVARISVVQGSVVVKRGDSGTEVAGALNAPLLPGDYVTTGQQARAEVQFDGYTVLRLAGGVQARITSNDPGSRQLQLADGTIEIAILHGDDGTTEVDTPSVTVRASDQGAYRITIGPDGTTYVTARRGHVDVATPQQTYTVALGKALAARGNAANPSITYTTEAAYDSFDQFNADRDRTLVAALADDANIPPSIAGYDDLNAYGTWQNVSGYGEVWVPSEPAGWAPYRDGQWTWEDGYGWVWVGDEPWGWTPYHYGTWFYADGYGWAWYPPGVAVAPAWSPALVGFFGYGGVGLSVGLGGFGCFGWVPLAPFQAYYPWYPGWGWRNGGWWNRGGVWNGHGHGYYGPRYAGAANLAATYPNARHGGASSIDAADWQNGRFGRATAVDSAHLGDVTAMRGALPITPTRANLNYSSKPAGRAVELSQAFSSPRFATNDALAQSGSFTDQQKAIAQAVHSPPARENTTARDGTPDRTGADTARAASADPWQRFSAQRTDDASAPRAEAGSRTFANTARGSANASDPWGRFSQTRGNVSLHAQQREHDDYGYRGSYGGNAYGRYGGTRSAYPNDSYPSGGTRSGSYGGTRSSGSSSSSSGNGGGSRGGGRPPR